MKRAKQWAILAMTTAMTFSAAAGGTGAAWAAADGNAKFLSDIKMADSGSGHTVAVDRQGAVWAWGANYSGELGNGYRVSRLTPVKVTGVEDVVQVEAAGAASLALAADGRVWSWGYEQHDNGTGMTLRPQPVTLSGEAVQVEAGSNHNAALLKDGTVWVWGDNGLGAFGTGTKDDNKQYAPAKVPGVQQIREIAAGLTQMLALGSDGRVWQWGYAGYDAQGESTVTKPFAVEGLPAITHIAADTDGNYAIDRTGGLWYWEYDQVPARPAKLRGISQVIDLDVSTYFTIALTKDGSVWSWGDNEHGQLGDGTRVNRAAPVKAKLPAKAVQVFAGGDFSGAVTEEGLVYMWGANDRDGQLGAGLASGDSLAPIRVSRPIAIQVDGRPVEVAASALSVNGSTLVPIRVAESLGAQVSWQADTHTVKLVKDGRTIVLDAEQGTATIDGAKVPLPVKPLVAAESVLIPLRFVGEAFGAKVEWRADTYTVAIALANR